MGIVRRIQPDEVPSALAFERSYVGTDTTLEAFQARYERTPELFIGYYEDGSLVGEASGEYPGPDGGVTMTAIGTKNGREHEGIASRVVETFEANASRYADRVTVASAVNVEGFYRACGYEPSKILLQVRERDLPSDYQDRVEVVDERPLDGDWRAVYAGFDRYSEALRDDVADQLHAEGVNTIYEKSLES